MVCMLLHYLLPVYAADSIQTEFERFLSFVHEHPQGGTFEMQGDMIINADIITSREITIYTNGYQVRIEHNIDGDSNVNIDNFNNDAAWGFVDKEKTLTIEGSGKKQTASIYEYRCKCVWFAHSQHRGHSSGNSRR